MSEFNNITITKKANVYFNGKVTSRSIKLEDGSVKSLGIMLPGDYEFNTAKPEIMEIISGELEVLLPNASEWINVKGGESFEVIGDSKFNVKIKEITDYCCSYIDEVK